MFKRSVLIVLCVMAFVGSVQSAPTKDDLKRIEAQLQKERKTQQEAKKKSTELANEIKKVQKQMVRSAKAVQEKENQLEELEEKLTDLKSKEDSLNEKLSLSDKQLTEIATGLQTLALRPPEMVLLEPKSPVTHLRSRMMLNYALPQVQQENKNVLSDMADLTQTRSELENQTKKVKMTQAQLNERASQMNKLIRQKSLLQAKYDETHNKSRKKVVALASQAKDLKELLEKIEAEQKRKALAEQKRKEEQARLKAQNKKTEETPPARPTVPKGFFQKAKGSLNYPIKGKITENFNDVVSGGLHSKGMRIVPNGGTTVTNIFNGTVLFAGAFKSYGQLLIVDNGDGYLTLLAGMEEINVKEDDGVVTGEPVGRLKKGGSLYLEIRKNGQAIDPKPWFVK